MSAATGWTRLARLLLRRDRVRLPLWVLGLTALVGLSASAVKDLYATPRDIASYGATVTDSAAGQMMNGRPNGVDTIAGIVQYETQMTGLVVSALMAMFLVVRHTRAEEESGRAELLRATVTGRHAATVSAVVVAFGASLVSGLLVAGALVAYGLPVDGALLHGAALTGIGWVFAGVAAVASQVTQSARTALGITGAVLGGLFVLRGIGDVGDNALTWLSPFGWAQAGTQAFSGNHWWPALALAGLAVVLLGATGWLTAHRDAGAGLIQPRPGPARAAPRLGTAIGLAWRLQRGMILSWTIGLLIAGVLFGSVGDAVVDMVAENPDLAEVFGAAGNVLDGFWAMMIGLLVIVGAACAISSVLRLRGEENDGRAEALLATGISRARWVGGTAVVTTVAVLLTTVAVGAGVALGYATAAGDTTSSGELLGATFAMLPGTLALAGLTLLLWGWLPRWDWLAWAFLGLAIVQAYLGELLRLPDWVSTLSPYWHLAAVPVDPFDTGAALLVGASGVVAGALGLVGALRRDVG